MKEVTTTGSLKEIWVAAQQSDAASCAYNESFTIQLHGNVKLEILEKAIVQISVRHDALSATFSNDGSVMRKQLHQMASITTHDLRNSSIENRIKYFQNLSEKESDTPFDLEHGPLWRAHLMIHSDSDTILLFTIHHIVCDGWSINVLIRDIGRSYDALCKKQNIPVQEQYSFFDFVEKRVDAIDGKHRDTILSFWKKHLVLPLPVLDLPADHPRPPLRSYDAISKRCRIDSFISEQIKKLAANNGSNSFSYFLGAYASLIYRLSNSEDIIVGVPVAGQSFYNTPELVGHCVSMLPVRVVISPDKPFDDFAVSLQNELLDAYDHHELTFGELLHELHLPRDPSRIPLISTGFTYAKIPACGEFGFENIKAECTINSRRYEIFELYATVIENSNSMELLWHFNRNLFSDSTAERWMEEYIVLLKGIIDNPKAELCSLPVLTATEQELILNQWNATDRPFDFGETVVTMFDKQAALTPDAIALDFQGNTLTYKELKERVDNLSFYLKTYYTGPDITIALCLERSLDMVVSLLGILKSGAAYIPIDPSFSDERILYILQDSEARLFITSTEIKKRFPDLKITSIDPVNIPILENTDLDKRCISKDQRAYIIYTSGSTGKPKGVEIRHFSLSNFLKSMQEKPGISQHDTLLAVTTISFDIAGLELLGPLTCGAKVLLADKEIASDPVLLADLIKDKKPTIMQATPATWTMLIDSGWNESRCMKILCGGEAMTRTLADRLLATGAEVWNMYGPTETTIWSSVWKVTDGKNSPPVGQPIANTRFHILNDSLSPVPTGVSGNLYISGIGLALGYRNRPELTAEKFIENPFPRSMYSNLENRMYKTGDIARWRDDGTVEVLGRSDFQVKIRGFRIETGEIESILSTHPSVKECVVIDGIDAKGNKILIAYIVSHNNTEVSFDELRFILRKSLPEYMVPSLFTRLSLLPRLANNKIDRKSLPEPQPPKCNTQNELLPPGNPIEEFLISIWNDILENDRISVLDNFFDLGGHSLLAVQIFNKIYEKYNLRLPLAVLIEHSSIRELAAYLCRCINKTDEGKKGTDTLKQMPPEIKEKTRWNTVVTIQPEGDLPSFFCVSGLLGNPMEFTSISPYISDRQPFYALQYRGVDGVQKPHETIEDMATEFIMDIQRKQPSGPYYLGGYSMGGLVAWQIAQLLINNKQKVAGVILLDSGNPETLKWTLTSRLKGHLSNVLSYGPAYLISRIKKTSYFQIFNKKNVHSRMTDFENRFNILAAYNSAAAKMYKPLPIDIEVSLIKSLNRLPPLVHGVGVYPMHESNGWRQLVAPDKFRMLYVSANHLELFKEPFVSQTAQQITKSLEIFRARAQQELPTLVSV